nr:hypothetical protein B0A51_06416 [Rachicladosporium sp. CCFEE 5018]
MSSHPDANLHPVATGSAKAVVDYHQREQPLKLYSGWFCPFVQRPWSILQEKSIPYQYIEVNPYHKPQSLLSLNPRGLVPTLQYDNKPLYESNVICEFLEEAYPDHGPKLLPDDVYLRAKCRIWMDWCGSRFIPAWHRYLQFQPMTDKSGLEKAKSDFLAVLKELGSELHPTGPWFLGEQISLVDFVIAPWVLRLWVFGHFKGGFELPGESEGKEWGRLARWITALEGRKSISGVMSEEEKYYSIYQRYADDTAQSELAKAVRSGKGVP